MELKTVKILYWEIIIMFMQSDDIPVQVYRKNNLTVMIIIADDKLN